MATKRTGIMLCYPYEERRLTDAKFGWEWPVIVQPKLDGDRARSNMLLPSQLLSSTAQEIVSVPHINEALEKMFKITEMEIPIDGELYKHGMHLPEIASIVSRTVNLHEHYQIIELHVFDCIVPFADQWTRIQMLLTMFTKLRKGLTEQEWLTFPIRYVPSEPAHNLEAMYKLGNKWLRSNYEGFVVRSRGLMYETKRSNKIMKFKPKKIDQYTIVGIEEALDTEFKQPLGMVGAFVCSSGDTQFKVGAGELTHKQRKDIWLCRDVHIGRSLVVKYQALTDGGTARGVPRFGIATQII